MRRQRLVVLFCFVLAVCLAPIAEAQLSGDYAEWANGPEGFLLTKKEKKEWAKINTDAAAEHFIALFWAKRNPEPNNPFNAFRAEFEAKVRFSDQNFGYRQPAVERFRHAGQGADPDGQAGQSPGSWHRRCADNRRGRPQVGSERSRATLRPGITTRPRSRTGFKAKGAQSLFFLL